MKQLKLYRYIDPSQRSHWPSHDALIFDAKNFKLYQTNALGKFCDEMGLTLTKMSCVLSGKAKSHKGMTLWQHGTPEQTENVYFN